MIEKPIPGSYWVLPDRFLAGEYPTRRYDEALTRQRLRAFVQSGFDTFIDLTNTSERLSYDSLMNLEAGIHGLEVHHLRFPFPDFHAPSRALMTAVLDAIDSALDHDHRLYLHCVGGIGRTGTTVGCWLVRRGMQPAQALAHLRALYASSAQSVLAPDSPEGDEQVLFILNWDEHGLA